ncbi:hypothetical protein EHO60_10815 [Leptospira fletcheri]|uniref:Uncharacterized protein n=1 Tax=Leptospira fletcheri TaxID=2484981 RepID=A0A4R9GEH7_9LEPT|nr:hypothetical protein [Leptospira fletcheri]TGK10314.1 hypothetical protein EHO60_10815 [Leptospira fletcheri]
MTDGRACFRVYFLSQVKTGSGLRAGIEEISSSFRKSAWSLGFPFDCVVVLDMDGDQAQERVQVEGWLREQALPCEVISVSRPVRAAELQSNSREKGKNSLFATRAAFAAFFEFTHSYAQRAREWAVRSVSKYSKVTTMQLLEADEVREEHDRSLTLLLKLEATYSLLSKGFDPEWEELRKFGIGPKGPNSEELESLVESWESIHEALEVLLERVSEKKFLFWEMLAEYTIVVLILLELVVGVMEFMRG